MFITHRLMWNISSEMLLTVAGTEHDSHCTNELICTNLHKACIRLGHKHFIMDGRKVHDASYLQEKLLAVNRLCVSVAIFFFDKVYLLQWIISYLPLGKKLITLRSHTKSNCKMAVYLLGRKVSLSEGEGWEKGMRGENN